MTEEACADWFVTSGAQTLRVASAVSYRDYVRRSANHSTPAFEDDRRQIDLDLPRTGASISEFILRIPLPADDDNDDHDDAYPSELLAPYMPVLRNILLAYSLRNPRVGYVQGHADVVCFLIGNINERQDEEEVFWVYASIIEKIFPEDFFARTPKLHGFQVDNRLFKELVIRKLVPHTPALAQVDLTLVTSLLSCKWFVSVWVGQLPVELLRKVWGVMLAGGGENEDSGGAILHLLLGLHFFQSAIDSVMVHMATEDWDSSYLYKIILEKSHVIAELDPLELLREGHTAYGLNDEAIDDMRSTLRLDPMLRHPEFAELARTTKFSIAELEQLHEEFTFVRFHTKAYERVKLRGVRQEYFESLVSREFATWPVDISPRLFQLMKPDGYGNVSFASLVQLLSVLTRGESEDKAALLFKIPDVSDRGFLNQDGVDQLADLLCCLFANKTLADTSPLPLRGVERDALLRNNTEQSPLLRSHFRKKLESLTAENEHLYWDDWLAHVQGDKEILMLMEWGSDSQQQQQHLHRKQSVHSQPSHNPSASVRILSPTDRDLLHARNGKSRRHSSDNVTADPAAAPRTRFGSRKKSSASNSSSSSESVGGKDDERRRRVSLLSKQMKKKFKISRAMITGDALRRNPFEAQFPGGSAAMNNHHAQLYWCQCAIS